MHPILQGVVHLLLTGLSVLIVAKILPGISVDRYSSAVKFSFVVAVFNAIAWYAAAPLTWGFAIITFGIGALIINGLIFLLAGKVVSGVKISGCTTAAIAALGVSLVNWGMQLVLGRWAP